MSDEAARIQHIEARLDAMKELIENVMTTLMLRGILTKPTLDQIFRDSAEALKGAGNGAAEALIAIRDDLPAHLRTAMGPPPEDDGHDH